MKKRTKCNILVSFILLLIYIAFIFSSYMAVDSLVMGNRDNYCLDFCNDAYAIILLIVAFIFIIEFIWFDDINYRPKRMKVKK